MSLNYANVHSDGPRIHVQDQRQHNQQVRVMYVACYSKSGVSQTTQDEG
jgi:hypothetical protein